LREDIIDIPYDMVSSVRIDKGIFSSNIIFKAPGLINSSRRGRLDKLVMSDKDEIKREQVGEEEEGIITAIPKDKAEDLLEVIRNGMDRDREVYRHPQPLQSQQQQQPSVSIADELMKLANLKEKGIISDEEFQQMKQDLIKKKT
jgi:Short C-terminal domain